MKSKGDYSASGRNISGFTFVEMMVVVAVIGLLVAIAVPKALIARDNAMTRSCVANLRQIDDSKQTWATDYSQRENSIPTPEDITPYFRADVFPECPASGVYRLRRVELYPVCSLFERGHTVNPGHPEDDALPD